MHNAGYERVVASTNHGQVIDGSFPRPEATGPGVAVESHGPSRSLTPAVGHPERNQHHGHSNECNNTCRGFGIRDHHQDAANKQGCASADHPIRRRFVCSFPCLVRRQRSLCSETHDPLTSWPSCSTERTQDDQGSSSDHHCDACNCHPAIVWTNPPISAHMSGEVLSAGQGARRSIGVEAPGLLEVWVGS